MGKTVQQLAKEIPAQTASGRGLIRPEMVSQLADDLASRSASVLTELQVCMVHGGQESNRSFQQRLERLQTAADELAVFREACEDLAAAVTKRAGSGRS